MIISVLSFLWLSTLVIAGLWAAGFSFPGRLDPEPFTVVLGLLSTGMTACMAYYGRELKRVEGELEREKYSIAMALADGYVDNFLDPALTQLAKDRSPTAPPLRFYIYVPSQLIELESMQCEKVLAKIRRLRLQPDTVKLEVSEGRSRNVYSILKTSDADPLYFDFPSTLLTLNALVDFKMESKAEQSVAKRRRELGEYYISKFLERLEERAKEKDLWEYLVFTDKTLKGLAETKEAYPKLDTPTAK